jgi:hypothetical protein
MFYFFAAYIVIMLACLDWWRFYQNTPPAPKTMTLLAVIVVLFCGYRVYRIIKEAKQINLGREGERAVGQFLESLRSAGCVVFHDIIADNFNLDHVIVSKKGIYAVETKTYSKPEKGEAKVIFDGEKLAIDGRGKYDKPIIQVNASSAWLKNTLLATTGKMFSIKSVILFPGWYVESTEQGKKSNTWVLNPKALPSFIANQPEVISQEDTQLAVYHLCRYIRVKEMTR